MMHPIFLLAPCLAFLSTAASQPCHLHVSQRPLAVDTGLPTFSSITAAQVALRTKAVLHAASGPTRVCIHSGTYSETLVFTSADSGAGPLSPTIYSGIGPGNVSISGALPITLQPLPPGDPAWALLPPALASQVLVADLHAAGVPGLPSTAAWLPRGFGPYGGCQLAPLELLIAGTVQRTARWPNAGDATHGTTAGFALTAWHEPSGGQSNASLWVNASDGSAPWLAWRDLSTLQLHGFWHYEWADGYVGWGGLAETDGQLVRVAFAPSTAAPPGVYNTTTGSARYYVTNALEALDEVGEYWVNASSGRLYYLGPLPPPGAAAVSVNGTLVSMSGTRDVWLAGVSVEGGRGNGIALTATSGIALLNVTLRSLGQDAVTGYLANDTLVAGAAVADTGCGGVRFSGGGDRLTLTPSGNVVVDSEITRVERLVFTYTPAVMLDTGGVAAHNELHDTPHFCLGLNGNDVAVLGNVLHNCTRITFDNAAIYYYPTDWSKRNVTLRHNFFHSNAQDANTCNSETSCNRDACYSDDGSAGILVEANIIYHPRPPSSNIPCPHCSPIEHYVSYGVFLDGTREAVQRNNILVLDGSNATFNGGAGLDWDRAQQDNSSQYLQELRDVAWDRGLYAQRYPALAQLWDYWPAGGAAECALSASCGPAPYGNVITTNVIVGAAQVLTPPPAPIYLPAMFNVTNNLVTADPGWASEDPRGSLNFSLAADSPAWALGFQRIPTECIGQWLRCPGEPDWGAQQLALWLGQGQGGLSAAPGPPAAAQPPLPWSVQRLPDLPGGIPLFHAVNTDKDGSLVAARLAGASGGVSDTRALNYNITRFADAAYLPDVAAATAALYASLGPTPTLTAAGGALVLGSVHRAALYIGEALHAPVLPAQALAFAATLQQACAATQAGAVLALLGCDAGMDAGWLWLKPGRAAGIPPAHTAAMAAAHSLVLVRALDEDDYLGSLPCPDPSGGTLYIHPSLQSFASTPGHPGAAALWAEVLAAGGPRPLPPALSASLRQWEWGLPDATVAAYSAAWAALHPGSPPATVLQGGVVPGYLAVPGLWGAYLSANGLQAARGVTVEGYWVGLPALQRWDGVLPFPAYAFFKPDWHPVAEAAGAALAAVVKGQGVGAAAAHTRVFVNAVGSDSERQGAEQLLGLLQGAGVCTYGLDCLDAAPGGVVGCGQAAGPALPPHEVAAAALRNASGELLQAPLGGWAPLTVSQVAAAMAPQWEVAEGH